MSSVRRISVKPARGPAAAVARRPTSGPTRRRGPGPPDGEILAALAALPTVSPGLGELAAALGVTAPVLRRRLELMEGRGAVELWADASAAGGLRAMLSARSVGRLGLELGPRGDRWRAAGPCAASLRT